MLSTLINNHASRALLALLFCTPCLTSCGGGGISGLQPLKITRAEVAPNPVPAPSAGASTSFEIRWQVRNKGYHMTIGTSAGYLLQASCLDCNNQLVTISCTSSISPGNPSARDLSCVSNNTQVSLTNYFRPYSVGTANWTFFAYILEKGLGLPGENDQTGVSVEFQ